MSTEPPPTLLLRNVRVLDFKAGGFAENTSLLVEDGRTKWIGPESGHALPQELTMVDCGWEFAISGPVRRARSHRNPHPPPIGSRCALFIPVAGCR